MDRAARATVALLALFFECIASAIDIRSTESLAARMPHFDPSKPQELQREQTAEESSSAQKEYLAVYIMR